MVKGCTNVSAVQRFALTLLVVMAFHAPVCAADVSSTGCSASEIQIAVDVCIDSGGGTVHIPACAAGETWQEGDSVRFDPGAVILRIKGAGRDNTVIGYVSGADGTMFNHTGGSGFAELGDMTLLGNNYAGSGSALKSNDEGVRNLFVHDLKISDFGGYAVRLCTNGESPTVIANCDFENLRTYAST